jgi:hypothetical protein
MFSINSATRAAAAVVFLLMGQSVCASLPDWSKAGYREGSGLPSATDITKNASCYITSAELAQDFGVFPNDSMDDSLGIQKAIDFVRAQCVGGYNNLSLIELPSGTINISREIHIDTSFIVIRGQGNNPALSSSTKVVFAPDANTIYDNIIDFDLAGMTDAGGGNGGWIWPGRGAFRVQTRSVHASYATAYANAPANRKDIYEGTVNAHWKHQAVTKNAVAGDVIISVKSASSFSAGQYAWVGAANSNKMYDQQGVAQADRLDMHMRQQVFKVLSVDAANNTITIDKPLEFDLPINSTSDGSAQISGVYNSRVVSLSVIEGVGFENFYLTQTPRGNLTATDAIHNYNNLDYMSAMNGFVFKWTVNGYARNIRTFMTGSHPIVTEVAKNMQFENNYLEGSWNKGKGGNGYFRNSKVWDSVIKNNTLRSLRHITLQWSASGNVISGNDLDVDVNLHGGWERFNLIENNISNIPYLHRDCNPNCIPADDTGTWYPIWWAAGAHAGGWSGASGPQNVFFRNTMKKQLTENGPFVNFSPYGLNTATIFQFGWDRNTVAGSGWEHLALNGVPIYSWTHQETQNYMAQPNKGINANCSYAGLSLSQSASTIACSVAVSSSSMSSSVSSSSSTVTSSASSSKSSSIASSSSSSIKSSSSSSSSIKTSSSIASSSSSVKTSSSIASSKSSSSASSVASQCGSYINIPWNARTEVSLSGNSCVRFDRNLSASTVQVWDSETHTECDFRGVLSSVDGSGSLNINSNYVTSSGLTGTTFKLAVAPGSTCTFLRVRAY